jgi:hypothetical protein
MTGRVNAIAVDPGNAANIAIGAANGGFCISTCTEAHFTPVFDAATADARRIHQTALAAAFVRAYLAIND